MSLLPPFLSASMVKLMVISNLQGDFAKETCFPPIYSCFVLRLLLLCWPGEEELGRLHGVSICWSALSISHLLFADDSLMFCQAKQEEV